MHVILLFTPPYSSPAQIDHFSQSKPSEQPESAMHVNKICTFPIQAEVFITSGKADTQYPSCRQRYTSPNSSRSGSPLFQRHPPGCPHLYAACHIPLQKPISMCRTPRQSPITTLVLPFPADFASVFSEMHTISSYQTSPHLTDLPFASMKLLATTRSIFYHGRCHHDPEPNLVHHSVLSMPQTTG